MRRKDREITDINHIFSVIERCDVVHISMADEHGMPYGIALNFGFDRQENHLTLYLHSALEGKKTDILKKNPNIWFQMDCGHELVFGTQNSPCSYSWKFQSVSGRGRVVFLTEKSQKEHALNRIIQHLTRSQDSFSFPPQALEKTCIWQIVSEDFTGKEHV
ncbi:hypothetical protein C805_01154 [Eubacterium sp. 14-2]|uniref:pyridoxamine 5'-phosphate oxidase family protein n=1 Tax=Eubacterium sp. 14-2 TaxID=1235790 RepID=UPI00033AECDB|nr:pyridoxamine 5'-phosphate oxidase family protein [Eubacterium sp. 14-2]EOT27051.1 hypothetical protein C805_01154 [Eubacterium sp. 14-2]